MEEQTTYTAFVGDKLLASGPLREVLLAGKRHGSGDGRGLLVFEDASGRQLEFDWRGSAEEVVAREVPPEPRLGPGRPRLGVTSREISLLPRHWEWLERQPSGASAALRRLVEAAIKRHPDKERARLAREATGRVMTVLAGNRPGFEEALRALYAGERQRFTQLTRGFPEDVRRHLTQLASASFSPEPA